MGSTFLSVNAPFPSFAMCFALNGLEVGYGWPIGVILGPVRPLFEDDGIRGFLCERRSYAVGGGPIYVVGRRVSMKYVLLTRRCGIGTRLHFRFLLRLLLIKACIAMFLWCASRLATAYSFPVATLRGAFCFDGEGFLLGLSAVLGGGVFVFLVCFVSRKGRSYLRLNGKERYVLFNDVGVVFHFRFPIVSRGAIGSLLKASTLVTILGLSSVEYRS